MAEVAQHLMAMGEITGKAISKQAALIMISDLAAYDPKQILGALKRCRFELNRFPSIQEIVARLDDGRPGTEEAWSMIPRDEACSIVWTDEMCEAWGVCRYLMDEDKIAARMAFKESYDRLVRDARMKKIPIKWTFSAGTDPIDRERVLSEAVMTHKLTYKEAVCFLPDLRNPFEKLGRLQLEGPTETQVNIARVKQIISRALTQKIPEDDTIDPFTDCPI